MFTPSAYPARVYVEAGGGGGGGGEAVMSNGSAGFATSVVLLPDNTTLMTANGGNPGRRGNFDSSGQAHSAGTSPLPGAVILAGRGGAGGEAGVYRIVFENGDTVQHSAVSGGHGGYVAAVVTLLSGQTLRACVGAGGAGGSGNAASVNDQGGPGANGFVIVTSLW